MEEGSLVKIKVYGAKHKLINSFEHIVTVYSDNQLDFCAVYIECF